MSKSQSVAIFFHHVVIGHTGAGFIAAQRILGDPQLFGQRHLTEPGRPPHLFDPFSEQHNPLPSERIIAQFDIDISSSSMYNKKRGFEENFPLK